MLEKNQLSLHIFWAQASSKGPKNVPFAFRPPWRWGKSDSSVLWGCHPSLDAEERWEEEQRVFFVQRGTRGVSDSLALQFGSAEQHLPLPPCCFSCSPLCFHVPVQRRRYLCHSLSWLLLGRCEHVVLMSRGGAKNTFFLMPSLPLLFFQ